MFPLTERHWRNSAVPALLRQLSAPGPTPSQSVWGGAFGAQHKPAQTTFDARSGEVMVFAIKSKMGALSNILSFVREPDAPTALQKLSKIPMVAGERPAGTAAA